MKFKIRQSESVVLEVRLGAVFGKRVLTGQGCEGPFGELEMHCA